MKILRLWLLVVLATLLPVRGAMAAAMLCPPSVIGGQGEMHATHDHQAADMQGHSAHHHDAAASHDELPSSDHDKCNLCSAFCSITPLPSDMPGVPPPLDAPAASFPDFSAPAASFLSDGQERPPRSI
ncbi:hypothetical protein [Ideonella sp. YS5]|uniref:hypothetical protein n=1 Tax=Ideonella sp. YS5 TaxID=3453714 RepID=UPI003EEA68DC